MDSLKEQLANYQRQHANRTNQIIHYVGIPAIVIGVLLLLSWVSVSIATRWHISFAWIAARCLLTYYYFLHAKLAGLMTVVLVFITLLCSWIAFPEPTKFSFGLFLVLFVGGGLLLFIGHSIEKSKPQFKENIGQLFVAPLFLLIELVRALKLENAFDLNIVEKSAPAKKREPKKAAAEKESTKED